MQIDLYLPCIAFQVDIRPGDNSRPTDLETAALHFIAQTEDFLGDNARQLELFLGLGSAVFQDLLIRMINRGWVLLHPRAKDSDAVLSLSTAARNAMDPLKSEFSGLRPLEQGRTFTVCYDLLGGGFAAIPPRFRSKAMAEPAALQPLKGRKTEALYQSMPYRKALNGFLAAHGKTDDPLNARILQALQSDRGARGYLRDQGGIAPSLHVAPPGRVLSWSDVEFYRCRFNVFHSGYDTEAGAPIPRLECVEQRNATVRRLGLGNAQAIVEDALDGTDTRLISLLRKSIEQATVVRRNPANPVEAMLGLVRDSEGNNLAELEEFWAVALERVHSIANSRLDLIASVDRDGIREAVTEMAGKPDALLLIGSPQIRSSSPELAVDPKSLLSTLTDCAAVPLIHGTKGASKSGAALSDQTAIGRLVTALPTAEFHVDDQSLDHIRSSFVADDAGGFLWLADSPLGHRGPGSGLRLDFATDCGANGFAQLVQSLPWSLQDWITNAQAKQQAKTKTATSLPDQLAAWSREVDAAFVALGGDNGLSPEDRRITLHDLAKQIDAIDSWIRIESNSAEFVSGADIQARAAAMLEPAGDMQALLLGFSGPSDLNHLTDLTDQICARLLRQDLQGIDNAPLGIFFCLTNPEALEPLELFKRRVGPQSARHAIMTQPLQSGQPRPPTFALAPARALIAHDGIVRFVPTIGRKVKGVQLAVQFNGRQAEREVAQFIAAHWPVAAEALARVGLSETVVDPGLSRQHRKRLIEAANRDQWFDDGNVGAATIARSCQNIDDRAPWEEAFDLANKLLAATGGENSQRVASERLGYAYLKAAATAPELASDLADAARTRMAERAIIRGDLLVAAIFADHLPEDAALREPLTRKLAYALARQVPPELSGDDELALTAPTAPAACLSCALMLDGKGERLIPILRDCDLAALGPEAGLARDLALYLAEHEFTLVEDLGIEPGGSGDDIDRVAAEILSRTRSAAKRSLGRVPPQVESLRDDMFGTHGAFAFELGQFLEKEWPKLVPADRAGALSHVLASVASDLGQDLYKRVSENDEIRVSKIAREYFDRKNDEMKRRPGDEIVNPARSGGFMQTTIEFVIEKLVNKIIPELIRATDSSARNLSAAITTFKSVTPDQIPSQLELFRKLLSERLEGPAACESYVSPPWRFPALAAVKRPEWPVLATEILDYEFAENADLPEVIDWFLNHDRTGEGSGQARSGDYLARVSDLLEAVQGSIEPSEHRRVTERLGTHVRESADLAVKDAAAASAFEAACGTAAGELAAVARAIEARCSVMEAALSGGDLVAAILEAGELRTSRSSLQAGWRAATTQLRLSLAERSEERVNAKLRSLLSEFGRADQLAKARAYLALRPLLARRIKLDGEFQREIGDGRVPARTPSETRVLMEILAKIRGRAPAPLEDGNALAQALTGFLSSLGQAILLPRAICHEDVWRISSTHPAVKAFTLMRGTGEVFVAKTRDSEIVLRARLRRAAQSANAGHGLEALPRFADAGARQDQPVLLALFNSQPVAGAVLLPWRLLALLGRESPRNRRIAVLGELSRQTVGDAAGVRRWWNALDGAARRATLAALLELSEDWTAEPQTLSQLIALSGDACLALGLFVATDREAIQLSEAGCSAIATAWAERCELIDPERASDPDLFYKVMDRVIDNGAR